MQELTEDQILEDKSDLLASFLLFTKVFYKIRTGREFDISHPISRESHFITIAKALTNVIDGDISRLIINVPPRYGKTELLIHFVAWSMAQAPDSNFLYVSYSHSLAKKQTQTIREIMQLPAYRKLFNLKISDVSSAKDNFETDKGGSVYAAGAGGTITGRGAGIHNSAKFAGAIIMDDIHKPDEVTSDIIREGIVEWYYNTLQSRLNSESTPIISLGQRLHERDLPAQLIDTNDWKTVIIPAIDNVGNVLYPEKHSIEVLRKMESTHPYVFASQYQQTPMPAGGGIFKPEWFCLLDEEPEILCTFITVDTAETSKTYNDATVFSFFGVYKIKNDNIQTEELGLHWISCVEIRVEPKDLHMEFMQYYNQCSHHSVPPKAIAIEKKSTGVTLLSIVKKLRGVQVSDIERKTSKADRFLSAQPYVASGYVSLPRYGKHTHMCIEHCKKITANNSHAHDDIADTLCDGIQMGLIDKYLGAIILPISKQDQIVRDMAAAFKRTDDLRRDLLCHR